MWRQRIAILDAAIFFIIIWGIHVSRIREVIGDLVASFPRRASEASKKERDQQIEQLAETIIDHGQMAKKLLRKQTVAVEVKELAFRLREKPKTITKALVLLRNQGRARRTDLDGLWELQV
jgi:hypothetical protein